jgi:hypothetical protein
MPAARRDFKREKAFQHGTRREAEEGTRVTHKTGRGKVARGAHLGSFSVSGRDALC